MTVHDLNDMQRYLVEEEAEKWRDGELTRREFMRRVSLLVGAAASTGVLVSLGCDPNTPDATSTATTGAGAATAAASPPAATDPSPTTGEATSPTTGQTGGSPYSVPEDSPDVKVEQVDISTPDGVTLKGYLAMSAVAQMNPGAGPGAGPANNAGILVIHENRGLTPYIKDVVRRLGKEGYVAMCVDLISREGGTDAHPDEAERTGILGGMAREQVVADLSAGLDYLKSRPDVAPERLGVVGFCFGGGYSWRMATVRPDLKAAVPYYGPNPPLEDVPKIKAAALGIYGERDTRITASVPALEEALKAANITHKMIIYPDADHAFHNDTGPRYNESAATDAWQQTLAWFRQYL
jgi:carboxymethylenebutenolidase